MSEPSSPPPSPPPAPEPPPRLRFAPSPTGYLHVGGARTALFNWLYAKHTGGTFLLRVEDTDRARSTDESTRAIFDGLRWLGLGWDEEVVFQGGNLARHQADADRLLASGAAYRDFMPQEALQARREAAAAAGEAFRFRREWAELPADEAERRAAAGEPHVIRFRAPLEGETAWEDLVHGRIAFPNKDVEDFVVLRSDRTPIYNLAVVSDDVAMGVTLVMRGDDHISNTPKQILLYRALGAPLPRFAHLPMIHGADGKKLSKRHGATAVGDYQYRGILPQAMTNFLALLGWSPGGDREVLTTAELVELFDTGGLLRKASVFDPQKLEWMNGQHLSLLPVAELRPRVTPALVAAGLATEEELAGRGAWYDHLLDQLRVRARTVDDIVRQAAPYLKREIDYDADAVAKQWLKDPAAARGLLADARRVLAACEWTHAAMEAGLRGAAEARGVAAGKLFQPLRVALTGLTVSPGLFDVLELLGRDLALARVDAAIDRIPAAD